MRASVEEIVRARALRGDWKAALFLLELRYGRSAS